MQGRFQEDSLRNVVSYWRLPAPLNLPRIGFTRDLTRASVWSTQQSIIFSGNSLLV